jgi:TonB-dependent Receptor Plug Domain/Carboxypeptidase regulatory-like domain/Gram-negative bacterial TonB protein C-terminal
MSRIASIMTGLSRAIAAMTMLAVALVARPAGAQVGELGTGGVHGTVKDSLGFPIGGVQISIRNAELRAESDEEGQFLLAKSRAGTTTIRLRRIGYRPDSTTVEVLAGQTIEVGVVLQRVAMELRPLVVVGRRQLSGNLAGFYERMSHGIGNFLTKEQIERRNPSNMTDLFRMVPGARVESRGFNRVVRFRGARCAPLTWLDGTPLYAGEFDLDAIDPRSIEGVEIYSGPASVPAQFMGNRNLSSACGTVILWSREGELRAKKRKGQMTPAAQIAAMVEQQQAFVASQVDVVARVDSSRLVRPVYPDSFFQHAIPGKVVAEFVVTQSGEVDLDTFNVVIASHLAFSEAVRRALKDQIYHPATRNGHAVPQVVQQPWNFVPDSTVLRRRN